MRRAFPAICIAIVLALTGLAEARDIRLTADPSVPAAEGKAELKRDRNGNLRLKVEVKHLAPPTKLTPPKQAYVVWIQGRGKEPENHGQLKVNADLNGSFEGTTPYPATPLTRRLTFSLLLKTIRLRLPQAARHC